MWASVIDGLLAFGFFWGIQAKFGARLKCGRGAAAGGFQISPLNLKTEALLQSLQTVELRNMHTVFPNILSPGMLNENIILGCYPTKSFSQSEGLIAEYVFMIFTDQHPG